MWDPRLRFLEKISTTQFLLGWQVHVVICTIISSVCHERLISHLTSPTRPLTWGVSLPQCQHVCDHYILAGKSLATRDPPQPKRKLSPFCPRGFCLFIGSIQLLITLFCYLCCNLSAVCSGNWRIQDIRPKLMQRQFASFERLPYCHVSGYCWVF